jgi:hypothetical protein
MKNFLTGVILMLVIGFLIFGFFYLSAKRERCESYGGVLVKDALAGWVCVKKFDVPSED